MNLKESNSYISFNHLSNGEIQTSFNPLNTNIIKKMFFFLLLTCCKNLFLLLFKGLNAFGHFGPDSLTTKIGGREKENKVVGKAIRVNQT